MRLAFLGRAFPGTVTALIVFGSSGLFGCAEWGLRHAVKHGDLHSVRERIEREHMNPNIVDDCGWTLLHYAAYYEHVRLVNYLLDRGVDINATSTMHSSHCAGGNLPQRSTALMVAAYYGQAHIAQILLERGADRRMKDFEGYSAIMYARKFEFREVVEVLRETAAATENEQE
jgi:uncharacterized protein